MRYGYARCSTNENRQDIQRQLRELKAAGADAVIWEYEHGDAVHKAELDALLQERAKAGDVVYCDPPYTHSQGIIYGAQAFDIDMLWKKIRECKGRGVKVILSINGTRESKKKDISVVAPSDLFEREIYIDCGKSMIDRLQNSGQEMKNEEVHDKLCLTW